MSLGSELGRLFIGDDRQWRRLLGYWAATCVFYSVCMMLVLVLMLALVQIHIGSADRAAATALNWIGVASVVGCYLPIRARKTLGIPPARLAVMQALIALGCHVAAYAISGPIRGASRRVADGAAAGDRVLHFFAAPARDDGLVRQRHRRARRHHGVDGDPRPAGLSARGRSGAFRLAASSLLAVALLTGEMSKLRAWPKRQREELLAAVATIRTLATIDELTSLVNRRHMNEVLGAEERREHWRGQPVCIALLDIDFFKSVNDRYGHAGGDAVLRNFAGAARADLRAGDVLARWGGEEFLLMLPDTAGRSDAGARPDGRADQRHAHRRTRWRQRHHVFGRAGRTRQSRAVRRNDRARRPCAVCLYVAKSSARNRVVVVGEVPSP